MTPAAPTTFTLRSVVHLVHPWGRPAGSLGELRAGIASAPPEVLFYHTAQYALRNPGAGEMPLDDFSRWVGGVLQDPGTAERLSFAALTLNSSPESVRAGLLGVLDTLPASTTGGALPPEEGAFFFLSATSVVPASGTAVSNATELMRALAHSDPSVWFHHLVEEPWFGAGRTPLLEWLESAGEERLVGWLRNAAGSGLPIDIATGQALRRWRQSRIARRVTDAALSPEEMRRETARQTVARFVRRVRKGGPTS